MHQPPNKKKMAFLRAKEQMAKQIEESYKEYQPSQVYNAEEMVKSNG